MLLFLCFFVLSGLFKHIYKCATIQFDAKHYAATAPATAPAAFDDENSDDDVDNEHNEACFGFLLVVFSVSPFRGVSRANDPSVCVTITATFLDK